MKLSNAITKFTGKHTRTFSLMAGVAIAGAALTAVAPAAQAQVSFGFGISTAPRYYAPAPVIVPRQAYVTPGYGYAPAYGYGYAPNVYRADRRDDRWREHEWHEHEWREREAWRQDDGDRNRGRGNRYGR